MEHAPEAANATALMLSPALMQHLEQSSSTHNTTIKHFTNMVRRFRTNIHCNVFRKYVLYR